MRRHGQMHLRRRSRRAATRHIFRVSDGPGLASQSGHRSRDVCRSRRLPRQCSAQLHRNGQYGSALRGQLKLWCVDGPTIVVWGNVKKYNSPIARTIRGWSTNQMPRLAHRERIRAPCHPQPFESRDAAYPAARFEPTQQKHADYTSGVFHMRAQFFVVLWRPSPSSCRDQTR